MAQSAKERQREYIGKLKLKDKGGYLQKKRLQKKKKLFGFL